MGSSSKSSPRIPADFDAGGISDPTRALAAHLSSHMGMEAALQVSTENQWHAVVAALQEMRLKSATGG